MRAATIVLLALTHLSPVPREHSCPIQPRVHPQTANHVLLDRPVPRWGLPNLTVHVLLAITVPLVCTFFFVYRYGFTFSFSIIAIFLSLI